MRSKELDLVDRDLTKNSTRTKARGIAALAVMGTLLPAGATADAAQTKEVCGNPARMITGGYELPALDPSGFREHLACLGDKALQSLVRAGKDPNRYVMYNADSVKNNVEEWCEPPELANATVTRSGLKKLNLNISTERPQHRVVLASPKTSDTQIYNPLPELETTMSCSMGRIARVSARGMRWSAKNKKFQPNGSPKVALNDGASVAFRGPNASPQLMKGKTTLNLNIPTNSRAKKKKLDGVEFRFESESKENKNKKTLRIVYRLGSGRQTRLTPHTSIPLQVQRWGFPKSE